MDDTPERLTDDKLDELQLNTTYNEIKELDRIMCSLMSRRLRLTDGITSSWNLLMKRPFQFGKRSTNALIFYGS